MSVESLRKIDEVIGEFQAIGNQTETEQTPALAKTGAEMIKETISTSIGEVHDHTIEVLDDLIVKINNLKEQVINEKKATIVKLEGYVALADDTLRVAKKLDTMCGHIEDSLLSGHT